MIQKNDPSEIHSFLTDASNFKGECNKVFFPETEQDAIDVIKSSFLSKTKLTIAGNGTGLTGGSVPKKGEVISTERLNKIISVNAENKTAVVQPGVLLDEFQTVIDQYGLFYPPDPTEQNCFIGGTVATNASGAKSFKYGATRNFVLGLSVILPNGKLLKLKRGENFADNFLLKLITESGETFSIDLPKLEMPQTKNAAGYFIKKDMDAIDLFIGSEGTLGFISEIELKLISKPFEILSAVIFFHDEKDALNFVDLAREKSQEKESLIDAMGLEFFDSKALTFLKDDFPQIPGNSKAAVWFEQDIAHDKNESILEKWFDILEYSNGDTEKSWFATDEKKRMKFINFRHAISEKVNDFITKNNFRKVGTDTAVPHNYFSEFYFNSKELVEKANLDYVIYGHFGDSHIHLNMLPKTEEEFTLAKNIYSQICKRAASYGGTISAEHGIGKIKRDYLFFIYNETEIREMAAIKNILDPHSILNCGNIFFEDYLIYP